MRRAIVPALVLAALALALAAPLEAAEVSGGGDYYETLNEEWYFAVGVIGLDGVYSKRYELILLFPVSDRSRMIVLAPAADTIEQAEMLANINLMMEIDGIALDLRSAVGWYAAGIPVKYYYRAVPEYFVVDLNGTGWDEGHEIFFEIWRSLSDGPYINATISEISWEYWYGEANVSVKIEINTINGYTPYNEVWVWVGFVCLNNVNDYTMFEWITDLGYYAENEPGTRYYDETNGTLNVNVTSYQLWVWWSRLDLFRNYNPDGRITLWINTSGTLYEPPEPPEGGSGGFESPFGFGYVEFWAVVLVLISALLGMVAGGAPGGLAAAGVVGFVLARAGFVPWWLPAVFAVALFLLAWLRKGGGGGEEG